MPAYLKWFVALAVVACPLLVVAAEPAAKTADAEVKKLPPSGPLSNPFETSRTEVSAEIKKLGPGDQAPDFKIKDSKGQEINLSDLTAKGPVLVRLTCGCSGCDKELAYFQELHEAYKGKGLTSVAVFREPDSKVAKYVEEKKLNMLYAVDTKGASWQVFQTKTMPTNYLIDKGGKIISVAAGCDPSGLLASKLSDKVAGLVKADKVDVQAKVSAKTAAVKAPAK